MKWVVATRNADKLREIREIMRLPGIEWVGMDEYPGAPVVVENGTDLRENALLKARAALEFTGRPAIADDTGLEIDALDGRPGIYAARFAGPNATYADNVAKTLDLMKNIDVAHRTARFRTSAVYVDHESEICAEGVIEGRITIAPSGQGGFGYDSIFQPEGSKQTFAALSITEKGRISHRARAFRALSDLISQSSMNIENRRALPEPH